MTAKQKIQVQIDASLREELKVAEVELEVKTGALVEALIRSAIDKGVGRTRRDKLRSAYAAGVAAR